MVRCHFVTAGSRPVTSESGVGEAQTQAEAARTESEFVFYGCQMPRYVRSGLSPFLFLNMLYTNT